MAFCVHCGKPLMEAARFCAYCGQSTNGNIAMQGNSAGGMSPAPVAVSSTVKQQLYDTEVNEHTGFASTLKVRTEQDRNAEIFERGIAGFMDCIKRRNTSGNNTISMNNPQVAALVDEVVKVCNDMFEAGAGMSLYAVPRYGYEGHVFFFVDWSSDNKSNVEIYMYNVGIPQSVSGPEANTPIGEHYNRFLQEYQQYYAPDSFQNSYIYRARTRVFLIGASQADKLKSLLYAEICCRCHLATEDGNGSFYTKNVPH